MNDIDFGEKKNIDSFIDFIEMCCPPELPGDDPYSCPVEVNENCRKCWARWLNAEE